MIPEHLRNIYVAVLKYHFYLTKGLYEEYQSGLLLPRIKAWDGVSGASFETLLHYNPIYSPFAGMHNLKAHGALGEAMTHRLMYWGEQWDKILR